MDFLVEMRLADSARPASPEAGIVLIEQYVAPTLEACTKLQEEKTILAGGPLSGAIALSCVVRAASTRELDGILGSLPLWSLMETTVTPLTTFEDRLGAVRPWAERLKAQQG